VRVLVTGGGGFIGSHVVDRLLEREITPRIFDLSASPYHSPLEVETFTGSITDAANLDLAMRDCDAVIHLAAVADVAHVLADPVLAEEVNTRGTLNVLEAACRAEVGRVVYGSTTWVYSDCAEQAVDEDTPIPAPRHLYTATKLAGETYCAGYTELYDLECTVLRFGIPYGPRARAAGVVAKFTDLALAGEALTIAGDGSQTRSFIYVEDLAAGIVAALQPEAANRTYNLSGDEVVTILEIAETVQEMTGGCEIVHTPPRPGDFPGKEISNARALEELGWQAETSFREGVRRYVEWVRGTIRPPDPVPGRKPSLNGNDRAAGALLAGAAGTEERQPRVLILTADIGEGHDLPARIIKADLESEVPDADVEIANGLEAMGRFVSSVVRGGSRVTFRWMPWMFDLQYWLITKFAPTRWLTHHLGYLLGAGGLMDLVARYDPDVVVSTYPGVTAVLGMLRENRRLLIPVHSAITDLAGLRYWAHPGVDLHFVTHPESIEEVEALVGPGSVEWARPPISPDFLTPRTRADARRALSVPAHGRLVLISGGGWGVGNLEGAIRTALSDDDTLVVCITGRNAALRTRLEQRFGGNERVRVVGFTEQMSDWMAAADAMVHSTAGLTVLEAHIRGCPVVSYGFSVGHLRANNVAFERFGLAEVARSEHELESVLRHVSRGRRAPDSSFASLPSIASRVLMARPRIRPHPVWRLRVGKVATAVSLSVISITLLVGVTSAADWLTPYRVISKAAKPIESRIHFGKDEEAVSSLPVQAQAETTPAGNGAEAQVQPGSHVTRPRQSARQARAAARARHRRAAVVQHTPHTRRAGAQRGR
jgi:UDP-glucose 4-epimerase